MCEMFPLMCIRFQHYAIVASWSIESANKFSFFVDAGLGTWLDKRWAHSQNERTLYYKFPRCLASLVYQQCHQNQHTHRASSDLYNFCKYLKKLGHISENIQ